MEGNRIILQDIKEIELPNTFERCKMEVHTEDMDNSPYLRIVPVGMVRPVASLLKLLICRNAWWRQLGWKPDWKNDIKYCIGYIENEIRKDSSIYANYILAFPTEEIRDEFLESFRDLIEEAKELL